VSFGHAAFVGLGAYVPASSSSIGVVRASAHGLVSVAVVAVVALLSARSPLLTRGVYFIMITLAFAQCWPTSSTR